MSDETLKKPYNINIDESNKLEAEDWKEND
jgi:hypothetical protein